MGSSITISVSERGAKSPNWTLEGDTSGEKTLADILQFTKNSLLEVARYALKEEQGFGFTKNPLVYVDKKLNKPLYLVNPLGEISFVSKEAASKILIDVFEEIIHRSKVVTGEYISSHIVFHNGRIVARTREELKRWIDSQPIFDTDDRVRFINLAPYAARLERLGVTAQRSMRVFRKSKDKQMRSGAKVRKPNGAYALSFRALKRRFKKTTAIKFEMIPANYYGLSFYDVFKTGPSQGKPYLYPSILIKLNEVGNEL